MPHDKLSRIKYAELIHMIDEVELEMICSTLPYECDRAACIRKVLRGENINVAIGVCTFDYLQKEAKKELHKAYSVIQDVGVHRVLSMFDIRATPRLSVRCPFHYDTQPSGQIKYYTFRCFSTKCLREANVISFISETTSIAEREVIRNIINMEK